MERSEYLALREIAFYFGFAQYKTLTSLSTGRDFLNAKR